ncbi:2TM domain-containing protein [Flavobacterium terrigena]|uniref:2TM domain-containing protein n=1 Tax=Flavobacterium terrigena TaxID=402734 RepID=A0A1H6R043_9FLAO|nr:2TM domain-containing protein [Flavobacterium terrigena]SEI44915.1 2TM domain-containing protein [Flavobacterium terrigena]
MNTQEDLKYQEAQKRVNKIKGFYTHLIVFILVNTYVVIKKTQHIDEDETIWHAFKLPFFWGIGLVFHGIRAFDSVPFFGKDWEERKIKEMMDKKKQDNTFQ